MRWNLGPAALLGFVGFTLLPLTLQADETEAPTPPPPGAVAPAEPAADASLGLHLGLAGTTSPWQQAQRGRFTWAHWLERVAVTRPVIAGPIFESWDPMDWAGKGWGTHYCVPSYERSQAATSIYISALGLILGHFGVIGDGLPTAPPPPGR